jgi:hypothetical protein
MLTAEQAIAIAKRAADKAFGEMSVEDLLDEDTFMQFMNTAIEREFAEAPEGK